MSFGFCYSSTTRIPIYSGDEGGFGVITSYVSNVIAKVVRYGGISTAREHGADVGVDDTDSNLPFKIASAGGA